MTRIIAGFAGSLSIAVPTSGTRPTSDRVREAIFSALDARGVLPGARVVDLYAGSGALGLEAASRGATHVTLVERGAPAVKACRRNASTVLKAKPRGATLAIEVTSKAVQSFLDDHDGIITDYAVVTDLMLGAPPQEGDARLLLAVRVGATRLLDNARLVIGSHE